MSTDETTPPVDSQDRRIRWRGHHTTAAIMLFVGALVFAYAGISSASTLQRGSEDAAPPKQILTVEDSSYVIAEDGALFAQGLNNHGQLGIDSLENSEAWTRVLFPVEGDQPKIEKVSSYGEHTLALDSSGGLWTWGSAQDAAQGSPQRNPIISPRSLAVSYSMAQLATGSDFAVTLDARGKLHVWGQNDKGQLGTGTGEPETGPTLLMGERTFSAVGAGADFAFAVDSTGLLWTWGNNENGQFGNGTKDSSPVPIQTTPGTWKSVHPSQFSSTVLAISADGTLHSWGPGDHGLIGNGRDWRAEQVAENKRVEDEKARIKAEDDQRRAELVRTKTEAAFTAMIDAWTPTHTAWETARDNWNTANPEPRPEDFPEPIVPTPTPSPTATPTPTPSPTPTIPPYQVAYDAWVAAKAAWENANPEPQPPTDIPEETKVAIEAEVTAEFVFTDTSGMKPAKIKEPEIGQESLTPVAIATGTRFRSASIGSENATAIDEGGRLWTWGNDENGQTGLGFNEKTHTHTPVKLSETSYEDSFSGPQWTVAAGPGGLFTWGLNDEANRLNSGEPFLLGPNKVADGGFSRVSGAVSTALASRGDGSSVSWGNNENSLTGQNSSEKTMALGPVEGNFKEVGFTALGVLGLGSGAGNIYFWGNNTDEVSSGQTYESVVLAPTRQTIAGFVDIAAGRLSSSVVDVNGFVWTWGLSWMGNMAPPGSVIESATRLPIDAKIVRLAASQTNVALISDTNRIFWWGSASPESKLAEIIPVEGAVPDEITAVAAGKNFFIFLDKAGALWNFPTTTPTPLLTAIELDGPATAVAAGGESAAAFVGGKLYGWGDNTQGQLLPGGAPNLVAPTELPPPLTGAWAQISVSATHTVAATESGVLYGWGLSEYIAGFGSPVKAPVHITIPNER